MIDFATFRCSLVPLVWRLSFTRILLVGLGHLDVVGNIQIRENYDENADSCSLHLWISEASQNGALSSHQIQDYHIPSKFVIVNICSSPVINQEEVYFQQNKKKAKAKGKKNWSLADVFLHIHGCSDPSDCGETVSGLRMPQV
jgi:hypothetical protein